MTQKSVAVDALTASSSPTRRLTPSAHANRLRAKLVWARDRRVIRLSARVRSFFQEQAERVTSRYLKNHGLDVKADADLIFDQPEENARLARAIMAELGVSAETASVIAASFIADTSPTEADRIVALVQLAGAKISGINSYTLQEIREVISRGLRAGYSPYQIAGGVAADGYRGLREVVEETYSGRAQAIARTEVGTIFNLASADRYDRGGLMFVEVFDGSDCGWFSHNDPDLANGSIRTIAEARQTPLAHPNCRRIFLPYNPAWSPSGVRAIPVPEIVHAR